MAGKAIRLRWQPTSSGSSISESMTTWTQVINSSVKLNHLFIKPLKGDSVSYDFKITSPTGNVIWTRKNTVGELNERPEIDMLGLYTLTIENIKSGEYPTDDVFELEAMVEERKNK